LASARRPEANREKMLEGTEVLWPEWESYYDLMVIRESEGPRSFQSEKQNEPIDPQRCSFMQRLIFLAGLAMGFLSYFQWCCKDIHQRINDHLRYSRQPKSFWFYRLLIALQDAFFSRAKSSLSAWCRPPP